MGSLSIRRRWNQDGVARPPLIDLIKRGIVFSNHKHLVLVLLPGNADQPVVQKRQVRLAHGANNHRPVPGHKLRRLSQRVVPPLGGRGPGGVREEALPHAHPREEDAHHHQEREEDQEGRGAEDRVGFLGIGGGARGNRVRIRKRVVDWSLVQEGGHCRREIYELGVRF